MKGIRKFFKNLVDQIQQEGEKLTQGRKVLAGMRQITPLIDEEWQARKALKLSSISDLRTKAMKSATMMDARLTIESDAQVEVQD